MGNTNHSSQIASANTTAAADLTALANEHIIDLELHPKPLGDGLTERDDCLIYLEINGLSIDASGYFYEIPRLAFAQIYSVAKAIAKTGYSLTGLKMEFGFDDENNMCLLFMPVRLDNGKKIVSSGKHFSYTMIEGADYYMYVSGNSFTTIASSVRNTYVQNYQNKIKILHSNATGDILSGFMPGIDVESMVFSFQEIFNVMYDNSIGTAPSGNIFTGFENKPLYIYNCVRRDQLNAICLIKHGLLLSPEAYSIIGFKDAYGNLAHLCPPHCAKVVYMEE